MDSTMESRFVFTGRGQGETSLTTYRAPSWLPNGHLQTIYAYFLPRPSFLRFRRERWESPDGDFIALDWLDEASVGSELVGLFRGLEGCSRSHYAMRLMNGLQRKGSLGVVAHCRGWSGEVYG